jgi:hypothetical protein
MTFSPVQRRAPGAAGEESLAPEPVVDLALGLVPGDAVLLPPGSQATPFSTSARPSKK